jgi:hypothetical protein
MPVAPENVCGITMVASDQVATIEPRGFRSQWVPLLVFGSCHY